MDESNIQLIGLTGGIATGKSTVSNYLMSKGFPVIDADSISHEIVKPGGLAYQEIINVFGRDVLDQGLSIDRKKLGTLVFSQKEKLKQLNAIMHPIVREQTDLKILDMKNNGHKIIFNDVPLLFENKLQDNFESILLVYCPEDMQLRRILERDSLNLEEAKQRLSHQINIEDKKSKSDYILDNTTTKVDLYLKIDKFLNSITK